MLKLNKCKICSSRKIAVIKEYVATPALDETWKQAFETALQDKQSVSIRLFLCFSCGFIFYGDILDDIELERLYSEEHRYNKAEVSATKSGRVWELQKMNDFVIRYITKRSIREALDVGAGDFVALQKIVACLPGAHFSAIDPCYDQPTFENITVFQAMLEKFDCRKQYDLVMAVHVLEHVGDLHAFMSQLSKLTQRYLYIEIPFQVGPGLFLSRGVNAQHINYFTPGTLKTLLSYHGFEVENEEFSTNGFRYNGMPGMIRILAKKREGSEVAKKVNTVLASIYYLLSPVIFLKSKFF